VSLQLRAAIRWSFIAVAFLAVMVFGALWMRTLPAVNSFIEQHPGTTPLPEGAPVGIPAWLSWQHFLNAFFLVMILRTAWIIRSKKRPPAFWTRNDSAVMKLSGRKVRMGIYHWLHLSVDALFVLNGLVFVSLLFATGQWVRIVPTSWDIFPNALSAGLQYASLDWPSDNGWVNYNSLQVLAYFTTVFIAAPIAIKTGLRLSPIWPQRGWLFRAFPEKWAIRWHVWVLYYFFVFIVIHVTLVMTTGALENLNTMYAGNEGSTWLGAGIFALSVVAMVGAWFAVTPRFLVPLARLSGKIQE
jgi:thiosulfate reductase cytochrome b subunit